MAAMMFVLSLSANATNDYYGDTKNMAGLIETTGGTPLGSYVDQLAANRSTHKMNYYVATTVFPGYMSKANIKIYKLMTYQYTINGITYTCSQSQILDYIDDNLYNISPIKEEFYDPNDTGMEQWYSGNALISGDTAVDTNWVYYFEINNCAKGQGSTVNRAITGYFIMHGLLYDAVSYHFISGDI